MNIQTIKQIRLAAKLQTCIREVAGSKLTEVRDGFP
jgi:hypothetical protein